MAVYDVLKDGTVMNSKTGKIIHQRFRKDGYVDVHLTINGKSKRPLVHTLVANKYIPNPLGLVELNHKDGNKHNNNDWNLERSTRSENIKHAFRLGLKDAKGEKNPCSKLKEFQVLEIRKKYIPKVYHSYILAKEYGVSQYLIMRIIHRKIWKHI